MSARINRIYTDYALEVSSVFISFICGYISGFVFSRDAQDGGAVAGRTRKDIEQQSGQPVVTAENFKKLPGSRKKLKKV